VHAPAIVHFIEAYLACVDYDLVDYTVEELELLKGNEGGMVDVDKQKD
jgi:hypothetical protein